MAFRSRMRKPDEDIQVFGYNLEALLRRAMPNIEKSDRDTLLKQQFVEGVSVELKRQLLQGRIQDFSYVSQNFFFAH